MRCESPARTRDTSPSAGTLRIHSGPIGGGGGFSGSGIWATAGVPV